ncbi:DUF3039 domain-containing protein, partial [Mycobacterium tuberculosis]|nr:DUF3039 domain-containing protein [Mycobacterium tuberculosis]
KHFHYVKKDKIAETAVMGSQVFVDLRRRRPLGLLETREAMLNCEEDGLLGCLNQWEATRELRILWTLGLLAE